MKLALAIVLCSGLYLCAVSATLGENSEYEPLLGNKRGFEKFKRSHELYKDLFGDDALICLWLLEGYTEYNILLESLTYNPKRFEEFLNHEQGFKNFLKNYQRYKNHQGYENYEEYQNEQGFENFLKSYRGSKLFVEFLDHIFILTLEGSKHPRRTPEAHERYLKDIQFLKSPEGYKMFRDFYLGFKMFLEDPERYGKFLNLTDPEYKHFPKNEQGYRMFLEHIFFFSLQGYKLLRRSRETYEMFQESDERYEKFRNLEGYEEFPKNREGYEKFLVEILFPINKHYEKFPKSLQGYEQYPTNEQGFKSFLKTVDKKYKQFLESFKLHLLYVGDKKEYTLKIESVGHLNSVDLDFKLKCVEAFQAEFASNPAELGWEIDAIKEENHNEKMLITACTTLKEQIGNFIGNLKKSGIKTEAQRSLEKCSKKCDILRFIGFWFAPNCSESALGNAIQAMKKKHNLDNDEAAKVMVLLKKFDGRNEDKKYP